MGARPLVAVFRPPDGRAARAAAVLEDLGADVLRDPLVVPAPTEAMPRSDADVVVLTSATAAELLQGADWSPGGATVAAIGPRTADALREVGLHVDVVPDRYDSSGLVEALAGDVDGRRVEVARSDHGSGTLIRGLEDAGAYVHETVLYRLGLPDGAGRSVDATLAGEVDALAFSSSLTVERFLDLAADRADPETVAAAVHGAVVGAIGEPTADTLRAHGVAPDVVAPSATFEALAEAVIADLEGGGTWHA
ncbi:MAG: uroporphyrinogen-III synthase [Halobacteriales archaeon]